MSYAISTVIGIGEVKHSEDGPNRCQAIRYMDDPENVVILRHEDVAVPAAPLHHLLFIPEKDVQSYGWLPSAAFRGIENSRIAFKKAFLV